MKKVICIGEALIDFIPLEKGKALKNVNEFKRACGGAPTNVCAAVSKLGGNSIILTKISNDEFGKFILDTLNQVNINTSYVKRTAKKTALAFASLDNNGDRSFSFYRDNTADLDFGANDIDPSIFKENPILHFCSVDLIPSRMHDAHLEAIKLAKENKGIISFDPNLRFPLWDNHKLLKETVLEFISYSDIVKISDDELEFILDTSDLEEATNKLFNLGVKWFIYSKGKDGCILITRNHKVLVNGIKVNVIDTTGAGDSLIGAILYKLSSMDITIDELDTLDKEALDNILSFANYYAAYSTTGSGAIESMATMEEMNNFTNINK